MFYHLFAAYHRRTKHLIYLPYSHLLESRHWHPARAARYKAAWSTDIEQERGRSHRNSLSSLTSRVRTLSCSYLFLFYTGYHTSTSRAHLYDRYLFLDFETPHLHLRSDILPTRSPCSQTERKALQRQLKVCRYADGKAVTASDADHLYRVPMGS